MSSGHVSQVGPVGQLVYMVRLEVGGADCTVFDGRGKFTRYSRSGRYTRAEWAAGAARRYRLVISLLFLVDVCFGNTWRRSEGTVSSRGVAGLPGPASEVGRPESWVTGVVGSAGAVIAAGPVGVPGDVVTAGPPREKGCLGPVGPAGYVFIGFV